MNRLLFTLTVVVLMAAHGGYCTTLKLNELQSYHMYKQFRQFSV